jgi:putative ABC transport system permease protein
MLHNDLKIAFRSLLKYKFYTLLNALGLALGRSTCLTGILIIRDQLGYGKCHPTTERICHVQSQTMVHPVKSLKND